ncbi:MAG: FAD:protein FMN transferase, partial [Clostridiales bacterium]|nr:FAD:protein FMN transferase [Clostridiales bacterium]
MGDKNGGDWTIGIRDPLAALAGEEPHLAAAVKVRGQAVVTSGVYERCFLQGETLYHHLLDPATGWPVHNGLASVTIVCADSAWADALSTACFVMGEEAGLALAEALDGVEALFIREDGSLTATTGLRYTDAV